VCVDFRAVDQDVKALDRSRNKGGIPIRGIPLINVFLYDDLRTDLITFAGIPICGTSLVMNTVFSVME
jgi:hypothetical protein